MSRLLYDEPPLLVFPTLATKIGLNETIVIQQIHYWLYANTKNKHNLRDGFYWTYNTYKEWQDQFPFWCIKTIRRTLKSLEKKNLIITGRFNKMALDRTLWYRINYPQLKLLENDKVDKDGSPCGQIVQMEVDKLTPPIPETIFTETTTKNNDNGFLLPKKTALSLKDVENLQDEGVRIIISYYFQRYEAVFHEEHPRLKKAQLSRIAGVLLYFMQENDVAPDDVEALIDKHFKRDSLQTDYNLNHFATGYIAKPVLGCALLMAGAEYTKYLQSSHWIRFRTKALLHHGKRCMMCGTKEVPYFHVHHLTYKNKGHEEFKDVVVLCESCHNEVHKTGFVIRPGKMRKSAKKKFVNRKNKKAEQKKPLKKITFSKIVCVKEWAAANDAVMPKFPKQKLSDSLAKRGIIRL